MPLPLIVRLCCDAAGLPAGSVVCTVMLVPLARPETSRPNTALEAEAEEDPPPELPELLEPPPHPLKETLSAAIKVTARLLFFIFIPPIWLHNYVLSTLSIAESDSWCILKIAALAAKRIEADKLVAAFAAKIGIKSASSLRSVSY